MLRTTEDWINAFQSARNLSELQGLCAALFIACFHGVNGFVEEGMSLLPAPIEREPVPDFTVKHWREGDDRPWVVEWDSEAEIEWMFPERSV